MLTTASAFILSLAQLLLLHSVPLGSISERTERSSRVFQYLDLPAVAEERGQGWIYPCCGWGRREAVLVCRDAALWDLEMCLTEGAEPIL